MDSGRLLRERSHGSFIEKSSSSSSCMSNSSLDSPLDANPALEPSLPPWSAPLKASQAATWTLKYEELPKWYLPYANKFIYAGYRPINEDFTTCVDSLFVWHNELVNVWSHLVPGLVFAVVLVETLFIKVTCALYIYTLSPPLSSPFLYLHLFLPLSSSIP